MSQAYYGNMAINEAEHRPSQDLLPNERTVQCPQKTAAEASDVSGDAKCFPHLSLMHAYTHYTLHTTHTQHHQCGLERWHRQPGRNEDRSHVGIQHLPTQVGNEIHWLLLQEEPLKAVWLISNKVNWRNMGLSLNSLVSFFCSLVRKMFRNWTLTKSNRGFLCASFSGRPRAHE